MNYLSKELEEQTKAAMRAAGSLREGLAELFTINRLGLSPGLMRCLGSTNVIESPTSGVRLRTRGVYRWRDGKMVLRWAAAAWLMTEKNFRSVAFQNPYGW